VCVDGKYLEIDNSDLNTRGEILGLERIWIEHCLLNGEALLSSFSFGSLSESAFATFFEIFMITPTLM